MVDLEGSAVHVLSPWQIQSAAGFVLAQCVSLRDGMGGFVTIGLKEMMDFVMRGDVKADDRKLLSFREIIPSKHGVCPQTDIQCEQASNIAYFTVTVSGPGGEMEPGQVSSTHTWRSHGDRSLTLQSVRPYTPDSLLGCKRYPLSR